jgi:Auxiliary Activity family 9 (formerly GH61)
MEPWNQVRYLQALLGKRPYILGSSAVWFKIDQTGKSAGNKWAATDGLYANGHVYSLRIPPKLKPGQYIMRHEM